jgi:hypothetical protein
MKRNLGRPVLYFAALLLAYGSSQAAAEDQIEALPNKDGSDIIFDFRVVPDQTASPQNVSSGACRMDPAKVRVRPDGSGVFEYSAWTEKSNDTWHGKFDFKDVGGKVIWTFPPDTLVGTGQVWEGYFFIGLKSRVPVSEPVPLMFPPGLFNQIARIRFRMSC